MIEEKKKGKGLKVVCISIFAVLLVGASFCAGNYVGKELRESENNNTNIENPIEKIDDGKEETQELDVNSRLVQKLYRSVSSGDEGWYSYWMFYGDNSYKNPDFDVNTASEKTKMRLVGNNLVDHQKIYLSNEDRSKVPDNQTDGAYSIFKENEQQHKYNAQIAYKKDYIEFLYKGLFGQDAKLDTSVEINVDYLGGLVYFYNSSLDAYVEYHRAVGGTTGPGGCFKELSKATYNNGEIKIYEAVTLKEYENDEAVNNNTPKITKITNVYTFAADEDGLFNFVSKKAE